MPYQAFRVETVYRFKANTETLKQVAVFADTAATSLERLGDVFATSGRAAQGFASDVRMARSALSALDKMAGSFDALGISASRALGRVDVALEGFDVALGQSAVRAESSASRMIASMRGVTDAAVTMRRAMGASAGIGVGSRDSAHDLFSPAAIGGIGALATMDAGIRQASETQAALLRLQAQTGRSYSDLASTYVPIAEAATARTGMAMPDTLGITRQVSSVIKDPTELRASLVGQGGGGIIDLVNVLRRSGVAVDNPDAIARNVVQLDHLLNAYTGPTMAHVNDKLYRAAVGSGMELSPLVTQAGYFAEQFRLASGNRKAADDDILKLAELGYWGIGHGKWGSGFGQILRTINRPPEHAVPILQQLGVLDASGLPSRTTMDAAGEFTPLAMIAEARRRAGPGSALYKRLGPMGVYGGLVNEGFPANAARTFAEALSPKTQGFLGRIDSAQRKMPTLMQDEHILMDGLGAQTERLTHLFGNLANVLAGPLVAPLTSMLRGLGDALAGTTALLHAHPAANGIASTALAGGAAFGAFKVAQILGGIGMRGLGLSAGRGHLPLSFLGHAARDAISFRGLRSLGGRVGAGLMGAMRGSDDMMLNSMVRGVEHLGGAVRIGGDVFEMVATRIGMLGARAIPVVAEVLLLIDTIRFLGSHAKDIGWVIGRVAHWIVSDGIPLVVGAFKDLLVGIAHTIWDFLSGKMFVQGAQGILSGWNAGNAAPKAPQQGSRHDAMAKHAAANTRNSHGIVKPRQTAALTDSRGHIIVHGDLVVNHSGDNLEQFIHNVHAAASQSSLPDEHPHGHSQQGGTPAEALYAIG